MRIRVIAGLISLTLCGAAGAAGTFTSLNLPNSQLVTLSEHGRVAGGSYMGSGAWRWTAARGAQDFDGYSGMNGMNSWGQPQAGQHEDANGVLVAALAYSNSNLVEPTLLGGLPGGVALDGTLSSAYDVADDGTAVGLAFTADNAVAFRWQGPTGMVELPRIDTDGASRANAISRDGKVIVGWNDTAEGFRRAVKWVDGNITEFLDAGGLQVGEALATNRDGSVVVGEGAGKMGDEAWRWTAATGVQAIGIIGSGSFFDRAYAFGVSDDGNLIGGASGFGFDRKAVVWTPAGGMQLLTDFLAARNIAVPDGWTLNSVTAVSGDGKVLGGWGFDATNQFNSFIVELDRVPAQRAVVEAKGTVVWNDLTAGPFAGLPLETPVTMSFKTNPEGIEIDPGSFVRYPIDVATFKLEAGNGSDTLVETQAGPLLGIANDYPLSDGIHIFESPLATAGTSMEFELFNPGGNLFDSTDINNVNRTMGPELFEKVGWSVFQGQGGQFSMSMMLESVTIEDECAIFCGRFED